MYKGLLHGLAWLLTTGGAVALSWWGVHTVMTDTVHDPPRALPLPAAGSSPTTAGPRPSPSPSPVSSPSPTSRRTAAAPAASGAPAATAARTAPTGAGRSPAPADPAGGRIKGYDTAGGRAVFDLGDTSATLVSATPGPGWSMQVWKTDDWIRVEFTSGGEHVSVFCTWHSGPPSVEVGSY